MKFVKLFMALVGLALVFIFCKDNDTKVVISFLDYQTPEIYLFLLIMTTFVLGMISASFANTIKIMQLKRQLKQLQPDTATDAKESKRAAKKEKKENSAQTAVADESPAVTDETPTASPQPPVAAADDVSDAVYEESEAAPEPVEPPTVIELPAGPQQDTETVIEEPVNKQS
jgi:uncharacterized integral membrane protein